MMPCICLPYLNKSDLALTNITAGVSDGDLPIVLDPALPTENVVDARGHFVPLVMVSKSVIFKIYIYIYIYGHCYILEL